MLSLLSDRTRNLMMHSWPIVQQNKDVLIDRVGAHFRAAEPGDPAHSEMVAMMLVELMISQSTHLLRSGELRDHDDIGAEHEALGISGRHYSRFGDALVPALTDILEPDVRRDTAGAWCATFRAIIRTVRLGQGQLAAA